MAHPGFQSTGESKKMDRGLVRYWGYPENSLGRNNGRLLREWRLDVEKDERGMVSLLIKRDIFPESHHGCLRRLSRYRPHRMQAKMRFGAYTCGRLSALIVGVVVFTAIAGQGTVCGQIRFGDTSTPDERAAAVSDDLKEAVEMLEHGQIALFYADFLPMSERERILHSKAPLADRPSQELNELKVQLTSAMDAKPTFNRTRTLAQIDYVLKPIEEVPEQEPETSGLLPVEPNGPSVGFGPDLSTALFAAVGNLNAGRIENFVRGMYALPELARVTQNDQMDRLIFRLTRNPEMIRAMIRDLEQSATTQAQLSTEGGISLATISLPPTTENSQSRQLKFDLIDGNWRFHDGQRASREAQRKLLSAPISGYSIPGSRLTLLLVWEIDSWKLLRAPTVQPIIPEE